MQYDNRHPSFKAELDKVCAAKAADPNAEASLGSPSIMVHVQIDRMVKDVRLSQVAEVQLYLAPSASQASTRACSYVLPICGTLARFKQLEAITHQTYEITRSTDPRVLVYARSRSAQPRRHNAHTS